MMASQMRPARWGQLESQGYGAPNLDSLTRKWCSAGSCAAMVLLYDERTGQKAMIITPLWSGYSASISNSLSHCLSRCHVDRMSDHPHGFGRTRSFEGAGFANTFLCFSGAANTALMRKGLRRHSSCDAPSRRRKHFSASSIRYRQWRSTTVPCKDIDSSTIDTEPLSLPSTEDSRKNLESRKWIETETVTKESMSSSISPTVAFLLLNFVTVLWGSQHAVIKLAIQAGSGMSPAELNLDRFLIAALIFLPFAPKLDLASLLKNLTNTPVDNDCSSTVAEPRETDAAEQNATWLAGLELGFWMFAGYAMQSVGLQYTTASRSAFLLYLNVKLVPIFASVLYGRQISLVTWASAAAALTGTALLGYDGGPPNAGDAWSVAAAAASALFILRLESAARRFDPARLNAAAMVGVAALCLAWAVAVGGGGGGGGGGGVGEGFGWRDLVPETPAQAAAAVYLGVVTTAVTNFLQTLGQRSVAAERAALIYALDPVYAAAFAYALLGERLGPQGFAGAALLLIAAVAGQRQAAGAAAVDPAPAGGGGGGGGGGSDCEGADRPVPRGSSPPPAAKGYGAGDSDA